MSNEEKSPPEAPELKEPIFWNVSSLGQQKMIDLAKGNFDDRLKCSIPAKDAKAAVILSGAPMTAFESIISTIFVAFGVPVAVFNVPIFCFLLGYFVVGNVKLVFQCFFVFVFLPLLILPQKFQPSTLTSWLAIYMLKYWSWSFIIEEFPSPHRPRILVGPPHGVFPYGCLMTMLCYNSLCGQYCRGLAARMAVAVPIFKQIMRSVGIVDANRTTARRVLEKPSTLGISTGGVAEIFETNNDDEVILLKERVGLIKLAIRTGADLAPCYIFGNTKILGCWTGEGIPGGRDILSRISRKLGFGLVLITGRFGLPIPRRVPLLGVIGKAIPTHHIKCEDPTEEQVQEIQGLLLKSMQEVFDKYKHLYGWEKKQLIIK